MDVTGPTTIRVLHVVSGDLWAGAEAQVNCLVAAQRARDDVEAYVVVLNEGQLARALRDLPVPVAVLDERRLSAPLIVLRLLRLMRRWDIDLVHTHRQKEHVLGALAASLIPAVRSIRTVHGAPENPVSPLDLRRHVIRRMDRIIGRFLQAGTIAVSEELASRARRWIRPDRVRVIDNGISLPSSPVHAPSLVNGRRRETSHLTIGFFGRLVAVKRADLLIEIAALVARKNPAGFRFAIYGDGPERQRLEKQVETLGVRNLVVFHGFVHDPIREMRGCDAVLITSDHEGLPTTLLEAMACGCPVIARAVGGIPEVLAQGANGTLVPTSEPSEFAYHLLNLREDAAEYRQMAERATQAVRRYSSENMAAEYSRVYREVLNGSTLSAGAA